MNKRECVLAALRHQQPQRIPYHIQFTGQMRQRMAAFTGDPEFESKLGNFLVVRNTKPAPAETQIRPDFFRDQFGILWDRTVDKDIGVMANRLATAETIEAFAFPDPDDPSRYADYESTRRANPELFFVVNHSKALFEIAWMLGGMQELMLAMMCDPDFVHQLLDKILAFNLRVIDNACAHDIDAMMFGDDYGTQAGLILSPELWREFIKPRLTQMYQRVKAHGKYVFIHTCGQVQELLPELIECGVDVFNPFQPEVMDLAEVKRKFGERLCFYGGVSTQRTLPYGGVDDVRREVAYLKNEIGRGGGLIAAPAHAIPPDARPENVLAMAQALRGED